MELQFQNSSMADFLNLMAIPLAHNSTTDWHVFSGAGEESESRKSSSNFSNSITKSKIKAALELFDFISFPSLVQFWSPTISEDHQELLDSSDLPFALRGMREGICSFRKRCSDQRYSVRGDRCGPPGRVFRRRFPEFCPDLRCYVEEEFELKDLAMAAGIRGYLCLPVFEPDWQFCIGVLDIFTTMDGSFALDNVIDKVSASLKEVGLKCFDVFWPFDTKSPTYNQLENGPEQYKRAINEIQNVLDVLCRKYKLPFAQTWVSTSDETTEESFISTAKMEPVKKSSFQRDCSWFHLRKGEGIVWKAFSSGTCFCRDLTKLSIVNYGLVLSARKVGFTGGFAICLRSTYTRNLVYIIELFLPPNQTIYQQPWIFLTSLLDTMKQQFKTFKLKTGQGIGSELPVAVLQTSEDDPLDSFIICKTMHVDEGLKNQACKAQQTPPVPLICDTRASHRGPETVKISENTASTSSVSKCFHNGKMVPLHDTTTKNRRNELHTQRIMQAKIGPMRTLCLGKVVSTKPSQELSENKLIKFQDNPNAKRSMSDNGRPLGKRNRVDHPAAKHIAETTRQTASCSPSPLDKGRCPLSSLSPVSAPVQNQGGIMTVKADFGGDIIKFTVPAVCGIMKLKEEVMKRLRLKAADFEIKYHSQDNIWVLLDTDPKLREYTKVVRSSGTNTMKVSILPRAEAANNATKITVKALYKGDLIKFEFPHSAGILELKDEIILRLQLENGSFEIKCTDDANNCPVLLDTDAALQKCINTVTALQKTTMRLCIEPIITQTSISDERIVIVKATYGGDIIKFQHSLSSGMMNLKDEVSQRLKLEAGSFVVKYLGEDGNEVLVDGDAALTKYMTTMTSLGKDTVRITLQLIDQQA